MLKIDIRTAGGVNKPEEEVQNANVII